MALNDLMEFDTVVVSFGEVLTYRDAFRSEEWAPEVHVDRDGDATVCALPDDGWDLMDGYSAQYGYSGPVMHPSEFVGGRLAADIMSTPGVYAVVTVHDDDGDADGWAVVRRDLTCRDGYHTYGPFRMGWGGAVRHCETPGCRMVSLDGDGCDCGDRECPECSPANEPVTV